MAWLSISNFINKVKRHKSSPTASTTELARNNSALTEPVNDFGGSRTTIPAFTRNGGGAFGALPKKSQRELGLDERRFSSMSVSDMIDAFIDAHPDVSFALWNFLRMGNSGYTVDVYKLGSEKPYSQGQKAIKELFDRFELPNIERFEKSRSVDRVINQLLLSAVTRGAVALELVMTSGMNDVAFFAPVDPVTIDFKFEGDRFIPYQNDKISLDIPNFFYEGLDELIDDPYGRSPLLSALNMVLFQLQILNDLKAVVHNQGYPRYDISIIEEVLLNRMPIVIRNNEEKKQEWLNDRLKEIIAMYNDLEPDDAFVHYDSVQVGMTGAGKSGAGGASIDPEKLMQAVDSLIMSGLKTLSTILGRRSNGNTESFAKIETKLYLKGVEAIQGVVEIVMSRALTFYLNLTGKQGVVKFRFKSVEIRTELEKAQFEQIALINYAYMRDQGWIDQEEAAMLAVGHAPVGEPNYDVLGNGPKNKDGETPGGVQDEKTVDSPTESAE